MKKTVLLVALLANGIGALQAQVSGQDLLIHYPFQGYTVDASGNGRNAQTTHTWFETGANNVANHSIAVDGDSSSTIQYNYSSDWNAFNFQNFTISTWARFDDLFTTYSNIFELGNGQVFLRLINQGALSYPEFGIYTTGGTWVGSGGGTMVGQDLQFFQNWHHFALTSSLDWTGTQRSFKFYIDGALYNSIQVNGSMTTDAMINHNTVGNGTTAVCIGYRPGNANLATAGNFQDFFLYARSVSETEVVDLFNHLCYPSFATIDANACDLYSLNGINYYQSGTYTQVIPKSDGCDSTITLNLTLSETPYAEVVQNGNSLEATSTANSYEWYDCTNGVAIPNSNSQQFTPTVTAEYAVILNNGSCSATSDCFAFTVGLEENTSTMFTIFPNPASSVVFVKGIQPNQAIKLLDAAGRLMKEWKAVNTEQTLNIQDLESGVYWMVANGVHQRLIIE